MELTAVNREIEWFEKEFSKLSDLYNNQNPSIRAIKHEAFEAFSKLGFPSMKHEEWKYTHIKKGIDFNSEINLNNTSQNADYKKLKIDYLNKNLNNKIVIIDGNFIEELSTLKINGTEIQSTKSAFASQNHFLTEQFGSFTNFKTDALVALNLAICNDGFCIKINKNSIIEDTIEIIELITNDAPSILNPFHFLNIEEGAQVTFSHTLINQNTNKTFYNSLFQFYQSAHSICNFTSLQNLNKELYSVENKFVIQNSKSKFTNNQIALSGTLIRNNLSVRHEGQFIETFLNGLICLNGTDHVDNHTLVDHAQPNCYSNENYRNILDGKAHGVFNGKIIVRPDAQKTNAFQSNKNILVSDDAVLNVKPQLEIFADDVKCSHGCTSAQLDEKQLFYLESRGIKKEIALLMLIFAFADETLNGINDLELKEAIEQKIAQKLGIEI